MFGIGNLSTKTGIKVPTIRYYEKQGLIPAPKRSDGNHRLYTSSHLSRLRFIKRGRELGFSLQEVRQLLGLNDGISPSCMQVHQLTEEHLTNVQSKIKDLKMIEANLTELSARCASNANLECPVIASIYGDS